MTFMWVRPCLGDDHNKMDDTSSRLGLPVPSSQALVCPAPSLAAQDTRTTATKPPTTDKGIHSPVDLRVFGSDQHDPRLWVYRRQHRGRREHPSVVVTPLLLRRLPSRCCSKQNSIQNNNGNNG